MSKISLRQALVDGRIKKGQVFVVHVKNPAFGQKDKYKAIFAEVDGESKLLLFTDKDVDNATKRYYTGRNKVGEEQLEIEID